MGAPAKTNYPNQAPGVPVAPAVPVQFSSQPNVPNGVQVATPAKPPLTGAGTILR